MIESTSKPRSILNNLESIAGPEHVWEDESGVAAAPANTEEVAALLRYANVESISVHPAGGGTKKAWSGEPRCGIVLHTHRLNAVLDHPWQDMTCTVQAGCTWNVLQEALARFGQFVALDPLWPERASVGGVIAANDSGALRLKYGGLRDLVIGMTVVLADGTIARTGGKVVKNVAGYDLHKLMIGAFGTLGLITEVTFRLHSLPAAQESFTCSSAAVEPLGLLLQKILDSHLSPQSLQIRNTGSGFSLDARLASFPEALEHHRELLAAMAGTARLPFEAASQEVWNSRARLFDPNALVFKATMLPTKIARCARVIAELGGSSVTQATGVMTASLPPSASGEIAELRRHLATDGGALTILDRPAGASGELDRWGPAPGSWALMQRLKRQFDPSSTLNPGCFVGGI